MGSPVSSAGFRVGYARFEVWMEILRHDEEDGVGGMGGGGDAKDVCSYLIYWRVPDTLSQPAMYDLSSTFSVIYAA